MNLAVLAYIPPKRVGHPEAFLENLSRFPTKNPLLLYSDCDWPGLSAKINSPEFVRTNNRPYAISNMVFLHALRLASGNGITHFIYIEADSRVGAKEWDATVFEEYFQLPLADVGGTINCSGNPEDEAFWKAAESYRAKQKCGRFPIVQFYPKRVMWGRQVSVKEQSCVFSMGSLTVFSVEFLKWIWGACDMGSVAASSAPWDKEIGMRAFARLGYAAFPKFKNLKSIYSTFSDKWTSESERLEMLERGEVVAVHQIKSARQPQFNVPAMRPMVQPLPQPKPEPEPKPEPTPEPAPVPPPTIVVQETPKVEPLKVEAPKIEPPKPKPQKIEVPKVEMPKVYHGDLMEGTQGQIIVAMPFGNKDALLAVDNLQWMIDMGQEPEFDCLLSFDAVTNSAWVYKMKSLAERVFKGVMLVNYPRPPKAEWPNAPNWVFQKTALYIHKNLNRPWLWKEPDMLPLKSDWLQQLQAEYERCNQPFMGSIVPGMTHCNGTAIYPGNYPDRCPAGMACVDIAFDSAHKAEMVPYCHNAIHLMQHVWGLHQGQPHPSAGQPMQFREQWQVDRWISPQAVTFHRMKNNSLIRLLKQRILVHES